jgi:hydroxypyruvate reductase
MTDDTPTWPEATDTDDPRAVALACIEAGVAAADPERAVTRACSVENDRLRVGGTTYDLASHDRLLVLGGGKAAPGVVRGLESLLGDRLEGAVVTDHPASLDRVAVHVGEHPVPGEGSRSGTERVLSLAYGAGADSLVLAVVTGGGSALLAAPAGDLDLAALRAVTEALLSAGADVAELNMVRRHCSRVKGGGLARACASATVVGLLVSDVVGDDPSVVASGPTAAGGTTPADALAVLDRYEIAAPAVRAHLRSAGTPPPTDADNHVLADARTALTAARSAAEDRGYATRVLAAGVRGEAREAARVHAAVAEEVLATGDPVAPPAVVLSGGEVTVTADGATGTGGPNTEFALAAALDLGAAADADAGSVTVAAVDTDGRDGSTDAAGAVVDGDTVPPADRPAGLAALARHDSHGFLDARDALVRTGPTGTNVDDLRVLVVEGGRRPGEGADEESGADGV